MHGDDYMSVGRLSSLHWLKEQREGKIEIKTSIIGHSGAPRVVKENKLLSRVVRSVREEGEYESDQGHRNPDGTGGP